MIDVVLPVLDEADAIPMVLAAMPAGYRAVVIDNGSTDRSADVARDLGATVVHEPRRGFGAACHAGLLAATSDIVCFMDCDATLDPGELPLVADPVRRREVELTIGQRRGSLASWPAHARLANRALGVIVRRRTGLRFRDLGPMRAARRQPLIDLAIADRRFGWPLEMVLRAADAGWRIEPVEVSYAARVGRSKVTGSLRGTTRAVRDMRRVLQP